MSLTFKILSLVIRTAAKPIGNYIKRQAKEHDGFRRFAVNQAQRVHRIDMRMRLGMLHDSAAQDRMAERERKLAEERKRKAETPTVLSELEQKKADDEAAREKAEGGTKKEEKPHMPRIRPLSEAKAIELGANFFSESFIFAVAVGLLVWDSWRSRSKAKDQRELLEDRLDIVEAEVDRLRNKYEPNWEALADKEPEPEKYSWYNPAGWWTRTEPQQLPAIDVIKDQKGAIAAVAATPHDVSKKSEQAAKPSDDEHKSTKEELVKKQVLNKPPERIDSVVAANKSRQPLRKPISTSLLGWTSRTPDFTSTTLPPGPSKMFCTTLRRRPSYASALSSLIATDGLKLRENRLETHDLAIPLSASLDTNTSNAEPARKLRILLLAPSWALEAALPNTLDRIHHFGSLTGAQDLAIVFLLNPPKTPSFISVKALTATDNDRDAGTKGVLAYAKLQASLLSRSDIPHIPILPLASVEGLPGLLTKTIAALSLKPQQTPASATPFGMLQLSTTEPPMDRETAYFATDCVADLRELAIACTGPTTEPSSSSPSFGIGGSAYSQSSADGRLAYMGAASLGRGVEEGMRHLRSLVGEQRYSELVEFWLDEWVVE
ncbi:hypothetical protein Q7P35_012007 [Cladosporium inversicolor]